ncbi:MAG TPA: amino acid racemase [Aquabacterium sp.]|nr:amino acid racemase [Aquabacterium sp.]
MGYGTIGILGGMGPAAGLHFAQMLVSLNGAAKKDADHVHFVLHSYPRIPSRVDSFHHRTASPVPALVASLDRLEAHGADFGVIVCNTAHIYFEELVAQVSLPVIHMISNAARHAAGLATERPRAGLLATTATVKSGLYRRHFEAAGIEVVVPNDEEQGLVTSAIFGPETGIKATGMAVSREARENLSEAAARLRERTGVRHLILGCTELSFASSAVAWKGFGIIDPVDLLARTCLTMALSQADEDAPLSAQSRPRAPLLG